ncbi:hypothetical protein ABK040_014511 [Willaertia magna]
MVLTFTSESNSFRREDRNVIQHRDILNSYPSSSVLKEFLQNANDAGARNIVFLVKDTSRTLGKEVSIEEEKQLFNHRSKTLFNTNATLYIYNDATFTQSDWEAISTIGQSHKKENLSSTGKFGKGCKSVFHFSDYMSIMSGSKLAITDPQRNVLDLWQYDNTGEPFFLIDYLKNCEELQQYKKQFEPYTLHYNINEGCNINSSIRTELKGTLFHLPLREKESNLCSEKYTYDTVLQLFNQCKKEMEKSILFLQNIENIYFCNASDVNNEVEVLYSIHLECIDKEEKRKGITILNTIQTKRTLNPFDEEYKFSYIANVLTKTFNNKEKNNKWLICTRIGKGEGEELVIKKVHERLIKEKTKKLPYTSIAIPLHSEKEENNIIGGLYTTLPLPLESGLPFHINGYFELEDNRQHLKLVSTNESNISQDMLENIEWNRNIIELFIPNTFLFLMKELKEKKICLNYLYKYFPFLSKVKDDWKEGCNNIVKDIVTRQQVFQNKRNEFLKLENIRFFDFSYKGEEYSSIRNLCEEYGHSFIAKYQQEYLHFLNDNNINTFKYITSPDIMLLINDIPESELKLNVKNILKFLLTEVNIECLVNKNLKLLLLKNGNIDVLSNYRNYIFCADKEINEIFNNLYNDVFIDPSIVSIIPIEFYKEQVMSFELMIQFLDKISSDALNKKCNSIIQYLEKLERLEITYHNIEKHLTPFLQRKDIPIDLFIFLLNVASKKEWKIELTILPTLNNTYEPKENVYYANDFDNIYKRCKDRLKGYYRVHPKIFQVEYYKIRSFEKILEDTFNFESFNFKQSVDLIQEIRQILNEYKHENTNPSIFHEFIQNAEDAFATEIRIRLEKNCPLVMNDDLGLCLFIINNQVMTNDDFNNIQKTRTNHKLKLKNQSGRFGVGFNSCYALTDTPFILSNGWIGALDPTSSFLVDFFGRNQGWKYPIESSEFDFKQFLIENNTLTTFKRAIKDPLSFTGTAFALPIRSKINATSIDLRCHKELDMDQLINCIKEFSFKELLFLTNIKKIVVEENNNYVTFEKKEQQLNPNIHKVTITKVEGEVIKEERYWIIVNITTNSLTNNKYQSDLKEIICKAKQIKKEEELKQLEVPFVEIAIEVDKELILLNRNQGNIYLNKIPVKSEQIPFIYDINTHLETHASRRYIYKRVIPDQWESLFNKFVFTYLVPFALSILHDFLILQGNSHCLVMEAIWPMKEKLSSNIETDLFQFTYINFYKQGKERLVSIPVGPKIMKLNETSIILPILEKENSISLVTILQQDGMKAIFLPMNVYNNLFIDDPINLNLIIEHYTSLLKEKPQQELIKYGTYDINLLNSSNSLSTLWNFVSLNQFISTKNTPRTDLILPLSSSANDNCFILFSTHKKAFNRKTIHAENHISYLLNAEHKITYNLEMKLEKQYPYLIPKFSHSHAAHCFYQPYFWSLIEPQKTDLLHYLDLMISKQSIKINNFEIFKEKKDFIKDILLFIRAHTETRLSLFCSNYSLIPCVSNMNEYYLLTLSNEKPIFCKNILTNRSVSEILFKLGFYEVDETFSVFFSDIIYSKEKVLEILVNKSLEDLHDNERDALRLEFTPYDNYNNQYYDYFKKMKLFPYLDENNVRNYTSINPRINYYLFNNSINFNKYIKDSNCVVLEYKEKEQNLISFYKYCKYFNRYYVAPIVNIDFNNFLRTVIVPSFTIYAIQVQEELLTNYNKLRPMLVDIKFVKTTNGTLQKPKDIYSDDCLFFTKYLPSYKYSFIERNVYSNGFIKEVKEMGVRDNQWLIKNQSIILDCARELLRANPKYEQVKEFWNDVIGLTPHLLKKETKKSLFDLGLIITKNSSNNFKLLSANDSIPNSFKMYLEPTEFYIDESMEYIIELLIGSKKRDFNFLEEPTFCQVLNNLTYLSSVNPCSFKSSNYFKCLYFLNQRVNRPSSYDFLVKKSITKLYFEDINSWIDVKYIFYQLERDILPYCKRMSQEYYQKYSSILKVIGINEKPGGQFVNEILEKLSFSKSFSNDNCQFVINLFTDIVIPLVNDTNYIPNYILCKQQHRNFNKFGELAKFQDVYNPEGFVFENLVTLNKKLLHDELLPYGDVLKVPRLNTKIKIELNDKTVRGKEKWNLLNDRIHSKEFFGYLLDIIHHEGNSGKIHVEQLKERLDKLEIVKVDDFTCEFYFAKDSNSLMENITKFSNTNSLCSITDFKSNSIYLKKSLPLSDPYALIAKELNKYLGNCIERNELALSLLLKEDAMNKVLQLLEVKSLSKNHPLP